MVHKPVNIEAILPHRLPMLMISSVLSRDESSIHCRAIIDEHNPFLDGDILPGFVCLELVAQASGIFLGMGDSENEGVKAADSGAIVSVKNMIVKPKEIIEGMVMDVQSYFLGGNQSAAMFSGTVLLDGCAVFETKVTVALFDEGVL